MNVRALAAILLLATAPAGMAQDYAGLGTAAEGFARVEPGRAPRFPADHGMHPDFRIEWWYVTANLTDSKGRQYGVQWTLFRQALAPGPQRTGWASQQFWMGHAALTSQDGHWGAETFGRGGIGQAGAESAPFHAWIDNWDLASTAAPGEDALSALRATAAAGDFRYDLRLKAEGPLVLHGEDGYSRKSDDGQASYYYSQPFLRAEGEIVVDGKTLHVTGSAWLDREWSSQPLAPDQEGWDWFSMHLGDGAKLMLFRLRHSDGQTYRAGTWISQNGDVMPLAASDIVMIPEGSHKVAGRDIPTRWHIAVAKLGIDLDATALNPESWMDTSFAYWEGPVTIGGSHEGVGYLEMTGYR